MKKVLKMLLWTIVGVLAFVLMLVLAIPLWLGPTVVTVANKVTPEYTGTPFSLAGVSINPYTGKYGVTKLDLGNPEGYPVPTAFSVSNVFVDVEMASLVTDTIHIREITINGTYVSYVSNAGTNNFEWIGAHVQEKIGPQEEKAAPKEKKEEKGAGKKVVIDRLTIAGTRVKVKVLPEMSIPTITLTGIGKEGGGVTWEDVGKTIYDALMEASSSIGEGLASALVVLGDGANALVGGATNILGSAAGALGGVTNILGNAAGTLGGVTTNILGNAAGALGGATTNLLGGASEGIGGATKALGDTAKKIGSLGGLLGGEGDGKASETNKPVGAGAVDAGKSVGKGVLDAGKAAGQGVLDAGKSVGEGLKKLNPFGK